MDRYGVIETVGEGNCVIRAILEENENISCEAEIEVNEEITEGLEWLQTAEKCAQYQSVTLEAAYFVGGAKTDDPIEYTVRTWDTNAASWEQNGNRITVTGFLPGEITVTAASHGMEKTVTVTVSGY